MKPAVRLAALNEHPLDLRLHARLGLPRRRRPDAPADRAARDAARDAERATSIRPADCARNARSVEVARCRCQGRTVGARALASEAAVPRRTRSGGRAAAPTCSPTREGGDPDLILIATGSEVSLALDAAKLLEEKGIAARVVSMPCWELFDAQTQAYRDSVLPPPRHAHAISIEAGATLGWAKYGSAIGHRLSASIVSVTRRRRPTSPKHSVSRPNTSPRSPQDILLACAALRLRRTTDEESTPGTARRRARASGSTTFAAACSHRASCKRLIDPGLRGMTSQPDDLRESHR